MNINWINLLFRFPIWGTFVLLMGLSWSIHGEKNRDLSENPQSLLWKISGKNLPAPSFIYGTIHLLGKSDFQPPPLLAELLSSTQTLIMELQPKAPASQALLRRSMTLSGDTTLQYLLGSNYPIVEKFLKDSLHFDLLSRRHIKPIFIQFMLIPCLINEPLASYEAYFTNLAIQQKKEIQGLETLNDQLQIFNRIPLSEQADMLTALILNFSKQKRLYSQLIKIYKQQHLQALNRLIISQPGLKRYKTFLIDQRNKAWLPRIRQHIHQKTAFIAIGAGHLTGEAGILQLLRQAGYQLTPVVFEF